MSIRTLVWIPLLPALACATAPTPGPAPARETAAVPGSPGTITMADLLAVDDPPPEPELERPMEGRLWELLWRYPAGGQAPDLRFPVVLTDADSQRELGLLEANYGPYDGGPSLAHKCFYYGDGGNLLSVSDEFLARYRRRGFSLATLCMGLVSGLRYHPESGARLATVMMADVEALASPHYFGEPGPITEEIPVDLPDCFARGLPLSDCRFAHHPFSGVPLAPEDTAAIAREGARVLSEARALLAAGKYLRPCGPGEADRALEDESCHAAASDAVAGYRSWEWRVNANHPVLVPAGGFLEFSPGHPEGFAYAIFADGAAGPSASMESVQLALGGKNRASRARLEALKVATSEKK